MRPAHFSVRGDNLEPETVDGEAVVGNFFEMLGVKPAIGRLIAPGDAAVAVLSWSWWKNKFNLDPGVVGRRIVVDDVALTVAGVAPREFSGLHVGLRPDIWVTLGPAAQDRAPLQLIARLRPGVSIEQARAEMAVLFRWTLAERSAASPDPAMRQLKFTVEPAGEGLATGLRGQFAKPLLALMAVVGLLLSIACINLANMLLARGASRRQELAVRVALGASRSRILRLVLTESLMLSAAGAAAGVVLAYFGAGALARMMTSGRPIIGLPARIEIDVRPDAHVLLFTAVVGLLTGLLFGAAPAWSALASGPLTSLREIGRVGGTRLTRLAGRTLVVAQVALSVGLLSAAGLFIRHLANIEEIDLGFRRDHVLLVKLDPTRSGYSGAQLSRAYQDLLGRLETIPGVRSATLSAPTPLSGAAASRFVNVEGHAEPPADRRYISVKLDRAEVLPNLRHAAPDRTRLHLRRPGPSAGVHRQPGYGALLFRRRQSNWPLLHFRGREPALRNRGGGGRREVPGNSRGPGDEPLRNDRRVHLAGKRDQPPTATVFSAARTVRRTAGPTASGGMRVRIAKSVAGCGDWNVSR